MAKIHVDPIISGNLVMHEHDVSDLSATGTPSAYAKSVLAEVIRTSIRKSREDVAQKTAQQSVVTPVIS